MKITNDLVLKAALGEPVDRTPVWVMRQAGRVLPEYRATRQRAGSFIKLVQTPELACEVTLQPVDQLGVDAAILFSDILVIPEAMGLPYRMDEGKGPWFEHTIKTREDLAKLDIENVAERLEYVSAAIKLVKSELNGRVPLIGFAGAPWTIFCYMVEGSGSKTFSRARAMLVQDPELAHALLRAITQATIDYLKVQVKSGCDLVQLFDSWAGVLNRTFYNQFALKYIGQICEALKGQVPITVFAKGAQNSIPDMVELPCNTIGLDWTTDPVSARTWVGKNKTLQGNMDPAILYGDKAYIKKETIKMLDNFGLQRYIANLGHGVYPDIDKENLKCFIQTIQEYQHK